MLNFYKMELLIIKILEVGDYLFLVDQTKNSKKYPGIP